MKDIADSKGIWHDDRGQRSGARANCSFWPWSTDLRSI